MKNIAILASGNGSNFEAIARAVKRGYIRVNLKLLLCDKKDAYVFKRAKRLGIVGLYINPNDFSDGKTFDLKISTILKKAKINLVVLAGFMRILSPNFVNAFKNKIINIHPAILPAFKGVDSIKRAFDYGCKVIGVTVHFVDEKTDHGPIILQEAVVVKDKDGLKKLEDRIHKIEHKLYPKAIKLFIEDKLKIIGRKVKIV